MPPGADGLAEIAWSLRLRGVLYRDLYSIFFRLHRCRNFVIRQKTKQQHESLSCPYIMYFWGVIYGDH